MEIKEPKSRLAYIQELELSSFNSQAQPFTAQLLNFKEEGATAKVVDGSAVAFIGGVPKAQQQDVLNSTLLAQLAANKLYDRETNTELWYSKYKEVLENIGWVIQNFSFSRQSDSGISVRLDKVALNIIGAAVSGNELMVLAATLKALEGADPESKEIKLFDTSGSSGEGGNFQLSTASLDPNNNVQMALGAFYFKSQKSHSRFLFFSWSTNEINIYAGTQNVILNEQIYGTVRAAIVEKLGDKAQTYVADIQI